jgi:hypothetical protein
MERGEISCAGSGVGQNIGARRRQRNPRCPVAISDDWVRDVPVQKDEIIAIENYLRFELDRWFASASGHLRSAGT